jgi:hypothetical protein
MSKHSRRTAGLLTAAALVAALGTATAAVTVAANDGAAATVVIASPEGPNKWDAPPPFAP